MTTQTPEKLTPGYALPDKDVQFKAWKIQDLHDSIMHSATRWARYRGVDLYGHNMFTEATAFRNALSLVLVGVIPDEEFEGILEEYNVLLFGRRAACEQDQ